MKIKNIILLYILCLGIIIFCFSILIAKSCNFIQKKGLKNIVETIWEGDNQ